MTYLNHVLQTILESVFLKINPLSYKPNFVNYMFREDMISDGIETVFIYHNFDPEKSKSFAYFTQIIHYAFLERIRRKEAIRN